VVWCGLTICVVDAELLEGIHIEHFVSKNVQDSDRKRRVVGLEGVINVPVIDIIM
jgi:hypothetical protein